jgi:hypothetical protein
MKIAHYSILKSHEAIMNETNLAILKWAVVVSQLSQLGI